MRTVAFFGLLAGCAMPTVQEPAWFCGSTDLVVDEQPEGGELAVSATLRQDDAEPADVSLGWSTDASNWHIASLLGQTTALASGPEGEETTLTWQSGLDLGAGATEGLSLRLVAHSACGLWEASTVDELTVDNGDQGGSLCAIEVETPDGPDDGTVLLSYTLAHPESLPSYVLPQYSADGGESWHTLTLHDEDCDDDGTRDGLTNLETSTDGVSHCLSWDSQADFASDEQVIVRLACGVGFAEEASAETEAFDVENDPTPDPGEVIISEILPSSSFPSGVYVELYNRTDHALNLHSTELRRWKSTADPDSSSPTKTFLVSDPTGLLLVDPGDYLLLAGTVDEAENGCIDPDLAWGADFSLLNNSVLRLTLVEVVVDTETGTSSLVDLSDLAELSFLTADGWEFQEGVAMGVGSTDIDSDGWADLSAWCAQSSQIASCEAAGADPTDFGTPGAENDRCR